MQTITACLVQKALQVFAINFSARKPVTKNNSSVSSLLSKIPVELIVERLGTNYH